MEALFWRALCGTFFDEESRRSEPGLNASNGLNGLNGFNGWNGSNGFERFERFERFQIGRGFWPWSFALWTQHLA